MARRLQYFQGPNSEMVGEILGGVPRSSLYKLKTAAGRLRVPHLLFVRNSFFTNVQVLFLDK